MEPNLPIITKKVWNIVRTMFYMLRKSISKGKLMAELNIMFKRWKVAGKAIQNLMFHHWSATISRRSSPLDLPNEFEFSCSNGPAYPNFKLPFHLNKRKHNQRMFSPPPRATEEDFMNMSEVEKTLEVFYSAAASPAFLGFGKSPIIRQLRVTDSPFPLRNADDDNHVDEAAEKFIMKFHDDLRRQIEIATLRRGS
ncbi:Hypothetical predicted protein [Olea europaea subsp. europaea]|uniref:Avr9/Cf-9 rapidly elicited protein 146 n=2 Tax=Olea europaea subsp. europaea TaxID=158383 RepID=A0A8S0Q3W5_OLEEU|nr:Hypothetical predicted protein [Olea europaea subsp. europaea]